MSEKRFEVENERTIYDNLLHRGFVCSWKVDAQELVGLLNNLNDENEQLKEVLSENEKLLQNDLDMLTKLRKENKELRMSPRCDPLEIESLVKENQCLKSENEQLRQTNKEYEKSIDLMIKQRTN